MIKAPLPTNEAQRLEALYGFEILDTEAEEVFDNLTRLAVYICKTPIALITLLDSDRQWFKSKVAVTESETSRDVSFCAHAILQNGPMVVNDAFQDERFRDNPMVASEPPIRFYAGAPLTTGEGFKLGTLCVIDSQPRQISDGQLAALQVLSHQAMTLLEWRRELKSQSRLLEDEKVKRQILEDTLGKIRLLIK